MTLSTPEGKKILPVAEDFAALNKNDTLEIIVGDKITVRYLDDRPITAKKDKHERFLSVAFTDAKVEFADIEPRPNSTQRPWPCARRTVSAAPYGSPASRFRRAWCRNCSRTIRSRLRNLQASASTTPSSCPPRSRRSAWGRGKRWWFNRPAAIAAAVPQRGRAAAGGGPRAGGSAHGRRPALPIPNPL